MLIVSHARYITGISPYVWIAFTGVGYLTVHFRDFMLYTAPERAPVEAPWSTRYAFNLLALAAVMVIKISAVISLIVWAAEDMTSVAGYAGGCLLFLAVVEHLLDHGCVELPRVATVLTGNELALLAKLWAPRHIEHAMQAQNTLLTARRDYVIAPAPVVPSQTHGGDTEILLDE